MNLFNYDMDDLEKFKMDGKNYNIADFIHGNCHYIALEFAKATNSNITLWFDYDDNVDEKVLCHAFNELEDETYFDARGHTNTIDDILDGFDYYSIIFEKYSYRDASNILKNLGIEINNKELKEKAKEIVNLHLKNRDH